MKLIFLNEQYDCDIYDSGSEVDDDGEKGPANEINNYIN